MPADATAAPYDTRTLPAGVPVFRTNAAEATASTQDVALFAGVLEADGHRVTAGSTTATVDGGIWSPGGTWIGPGTHQETTTTYVLVQPTAGHLSAVAEGLLLDVNAASFRLHHDGLVQFPWAEGVVDHGQEHQTLAGEQVLLGGQITWTTVDTALEGAPQIRLAGHGVVDYVHVGALPPPLSATEKAAIAGGAAATAGAVAAALWYWPVLKFTASGVVAGLYARVPKDKVLQHKGREQVYELIKGEPGISTNRLAEGVDFGWSTLTYHLRVLERTEKIASVRDGRHKRFFDRESGRFANGRKHLVSVLKNESTLEIAKYILTQPGVTQKDVGEAFALAPSSVHWHVTRLTEAELITKERDRHRVRYYPGDNWQKISAEDVGIEASLMPKVTPPGPAPDGAANA
jgi:DNA-binding transcriptional ArsR family regulator